MSPGPMSLGELTSYVLSSASFSQFGLVQQMNIEILNATNQSLNHKSHCTLVAQTYKLSIIVIHEGKFIVRSSCKVVHNDQVQVKHLKDWPKGSCFIRLYCNSLYPLGKVPHPFMSPTYLPTYLPKCMYVSLMYDRVLTVCLE